MMVRGMVGGWWRKKCGEIGGDYIAIYTDFFGAKDTTGGVIVYCSTHI